MQQINEAPQKLFLDEKNFLAEWMFNPDIKEDANYQHLDKNLALTRLSSRYNEPERARALLEALHTLSKLPYFYEVKQKEIVDYKEEQLFFIQCECGAKYEGEEMVICSDCGKEATEKGSFIQKIPIYEEIIKNVSLFPKSFHLLKSRFYSLTTTASARDGHLLRSATTTNLRKEESIEDKTAVKGRWGGLTGNKDNKRY